MYYISTLYLFCHRGIHIKLPIMPRIKSKHISIFTSFVKVINAWRQSLWVIMQAYNRNILFFRTCNSRLYIFVIYYSRFTR